MLLATAVLLAVFYYWGKPDAYHRLLGSSLEPVREGLPAAWAGLFPYAWWALASLFLRVVVPLVLIVWLLRARPRDFGFRCSRRHAGLYLLMYLAMLPVLYIVSLDPDFARTYPFYRGAATGWGVFFAFEACYFLQFVGVEAFFRGFLTFGLFPRFGYASLLVMAIPYCAIHFGKPALETFGSIGAGVLLGFLALKSRSWYLGALLHGAIGLTMDFFALWNNGGIGR